MAVRGEGRLKRLICFLNMTLINTSEKDSIQLFPNNCKIQHTSYMACLKIVFQYIFYQDTNKWVVAFFKGPMCTKYVNPVLSGRLSVISL